MPRIAERRGFWFVNFDKDAIDLNEYPGDTSDRIDMIADQSAAGLDVINGCHEYYIRANYKLDVREQLRRLTSFALRQR